MSEPSDAPARRGWWRRSAPALASILVLLPVTALVIGGNEWWGVNQAHPVLPTVADGGAPTEWAGASWGPATARFAPADPDDDLPSGARVLVIEVAVDPHGAVLSCGIPELREVEGQGRQWNHAMNDIDWDYDLPSLCPSDSVEPFTLEVPFLLPADAVGPFGIDLSPGDALPRFLRLVVEP